MKYKPIRQTLSSKPVVLISPGIPRPLHALNPRTIMQPWNGWWNARRQEVFERVDFRCQGCGVERKLEDYTTHLDCHEDFLIRHDVGRAIYQGDWSLCKLCHDHVHLGRLKSAAIHGRQGKSWSYAAHVMEHGQRLIEEYDLQPTAKLYNDYADIYSAIGNNLKKHEYRNMAEDLDIEDRHYGLIRSDEYVPFEEWRLEALGYTFMPRFLSLKDHNKFYRRHRDNISKRDKYIQPITVEYYDPELQEYSTYSWHNAYTTLD